MLPMFKRLSAITIYTPDLARALEIYRGLGLESDSDGAAGTGGGAVLTEVPLRFTAGDTELVLHSDPQRQFIEVTVSVDDVPEVYRRLARHPAYQWLEAPRLKGACWTAMVRLPDDNVFTLRSQANVATSSQGRER